MIFGLAGEIVDFIGIAHDVVEFEGFGLKDAFDLARCRFVGLRLFFPFGPWLGEEFSLRMEVSPDVIPLGVTCPNELVGVGNNRLLPKGMDIGDQDFFTMAFYLLGCP